MNYIVADFEFNQPFDFPDGGITSLDKTCPAEIIQIGAVKLNESFEAAGQINLYVRPVIYRRLHPFVEKLTGITRDTLRGQPLFPQAYAEFTDFIGAGEHVLCTWGADDAKELYKNILYYNLDDGLLTKKYINVQRLAGTHLKRGSACIGLKSAVEALGMESDEPFHDAFNDAVYTAGIFQIVRKDGMDIQTFDLKSLKDRLQAYRNIV